ncbi:MAG: O-antigen ligase family protein [Patescibacteria group bacterium]
MNRIARWLGFGLGLYVALLPWQTRLIVAQPHIGATPTEYGTLSLYATDILLIFLAVGAALLPRRRAGSRSMWLAIGALGVVIFGSLIFANRSDVALYSLRLFVLGVLLWWVVQQEWVKPTFLLACFVGGAVLQALFGIGQFFTQSSPAFSWLGLASHDPGLSGTSVVEVGGMRWLRAYGSLPHPNILGGYLAVALLITFGFYLRMYDDVRKGFATWTRENVRRHVEGRKWHIHQAWRIAGLLLTLTILLLGLLLTFSRSGWVGFAAGWLVMLVFLLILRWPWGWRLWAKWTVFMVVIAGVTALVLPQLFLARSEATGRLEQKSISERQQQFTDAYALIKLEPLRGVGYGNMPVAVYDQLTRERGNVHAYQPVHNIYLLSVVELGVIGGLVYLAFLLTVLRRQLLQTLQHPTWASLVLQGSFSALLVIGLFDHYLWTLSAGAMLVWLSIAIQEKIHAR